MLDTNGYVCEATGENFFIVRNGVIKTPPLTAILDGITRVHHQDRPRSRLHREEQLSPAMKSIMPTKRSSAAPPPN